MTITAGNITTDADGWGFRSGSRFVGPKEWLDGLPRKLTTDSLHMSVYTEALALAADGHGIILDFRPDTFYEVNLSYMLRDANDDRDWKLRYDRFVAMLLMDVDVMLAEGGYLAGRGNGDSKDRRLTLPADRT